MTICLLGGSGRTGRLVVQEAQKRGLSLLVVTRGDGVQRERMPGVTPVMAPHLAAPQVVEAVRASSVVLSALGPRRTTLPNELAQPVGVLATVAAGVGARVVLTSAAPVGAPHVGENQAYRRVGHPLVQRVFARAYAELLRMEQAVSDSGVEHVVLRPPRLLDGRGRAYRADPTGAVLGGRSLDRVALAVALLDAVEHPDWTGRTVGLARA